MIRALWVLLLMGLPFLVTACSPAEEERADDRPPKAEYAAAVEATRKCVEELGFTVSEPTEEPPNGYLSWGVDVAPGSSEARDECATRFLDEVEAAYLQPERLTGKARESAMQSLVECLADNGLPGLDPATTDSTIFVKQIFGSGISDDDVEGALLCMETYRGVWPPGDSNNP